MKQKESAHYWNMECIAEFDNRFKPLLYSAPGTYWLYAEFYNIEVKRFI